MSLAGKNLVFKNIFISPFQRVFVRFGFSRLQILEHPELGQPRYMRNVPDSKIIKLCESLAAGDLARLKQ